MRTCFNSTSLVYRHFRVILNALAISLRSISSSATRGKKGENSSKEEKRKCHEIFYLSQVKRTENIPFV